MSTNKTGSMEISGIPIEFVKKDIKNLHVGVYPPSGRVRVAAPLTMSDEAIRIAVIERLSWIKRQIANFQSHHREPQREMASGESHYFLGHRYRLDVVEQGKLRKVEVRGKTILTLYSKPGDTVVQMEKTLLQWYREQLDQIVPPMLEKWQNILGVKASQWSVKRMKTKWGSCNPTDRHIWLNLELAKHPPHLIEYVVVHELAHLAKPNHGKTFEQSMDLALPNWRSLREELNHLVLGHQSWK